MESCKHNLPTEPTPFVGRETEIAEIVSLLDNEYCRLLTLAGPGGMGKTRLAQRVAEKLTQPHSDPARAPYTDGAMFVALQYVSSPNQVASTIANALDWDTYQGNDPEAELLAYLRDKRLLLILDNFEHLLEAAPLVQEMLNVAPEIKLVVTSRAVLNLAQEWLVQVDGMSLPPDKGEDESADSDAVRLFVDRAQRVRHDFSLDRERTQVVRICRLVEGMPLAIELAAAWLRRLSCADIASEIKHGLGILASDQLGVSERHHAIRVVFDRSWQLLEQDERAVFMALSVFRGGFLRDAAGKAAGATLPILSALVDKSLLRVTAEGRYVIHELQRQYAAERLDEAPELKAKVRDEHSRYYLKFVARPALHYLAPGNRELLAEIEADIDNILAAWYWAVEQRRLSDLRMATEALYWISWMSTYHLEVERAFRYAADVLRCEQIGDEQRTVYAYVLASHGSIQIWLGRTQEANEELRESVAMLRELPDARRELGFAVGALGWSFFVASCFTEATPLFYEAAVLDEETGQPEQQAWIYCMLAISARRQNAFNEEEQWSQEALNLGRAIHDQRTIAHSLRELGLLAIQRGEYASARQYLEESLLTARSHDIPSFVNMALIGLGMVAEATGEFDEASHYLQQSLEVARLEGREPQIAESMIALAHVRTAQGEYEAAASLYQEAADILIEVEFSQDRIQLLAGMAALALTTEDHDRAASLYEECLSLSRRSEYRSEDAQALVGLGLSALRRGDTRKARRHLLDAMEEGLSVGMAPSILDGVAAVAELLEVEGDLTYAAQLATLAANHPASTAQTILQADTLLDQIIPALSPDTRERIREGGAAAVEIEAVARRLVAELTRLSEKPAAEQQPLIEPLSDRELQVLRMVAAGKSNREIGRELYLALGTVKSHLHHIFQKLDVQSRTQAVTRAIDLKLL